MSRKPRLLSKTGMYHIIFKGIGRQNLFEERADYEKLKDIIATVKSEMEFDLYAYCLMTNHVHLFIKEKNAGEISKTMSKILSHYATWFNIKYIRSGPLFNNRYLSEPVEDEKYYMNLIRYIHQNPLKARVVGRISQYQYSSYSAYVDGDNTFVDIDFFLNMLSDNRKTATESFAQLNASEEEESFEITSSHKKSDAHIRRIIKSELDIDDPALIKSFDMQLRNAVVKKLVEEMGISKSALERETGISRGTIIRICKGKQKRITKSKMAEQVKKQTEKKVEQKLPRPQTVQQRRSLPAELL
ncbi:MAG: transposase [Clostridia bacterium]|nr:transposase [Clostridia bacterium]